MIKFTTNFIRSLKTIGIKRYILRKINLPELSKEENKQIREQGLAKDKFEDINLGKDRTDDKENKYVGYNYSVKNITTPEDDVISVVLIDARLCSKDCKDYQNYKDFNLEEILASKESKSRIAIPNDGRNSVINMYKNGHLIISWDCNFQSEIADAKQLNPNPVELSFDIKDNCLLFNLKQDAFQVSNYFKEKIDMTTSPINLKTLVYLAELGFNPLVKEKLYSEINKKVAISCKTTSDVPSVMSYPQNLPRQDETIKIKEKRI